MAGYDTPTDCVLMHGIASLLTLLAIMASFCTVVQQVASAMKWARAAFRASWMGLEGLYQGRKDSPGSSWWTETPKYGSIVQDGEGNIVMIVVDGLPASPSPVPSIVMHAPAAAHCLAPAPARFQPPAPARFQPVTMTATATRRPACNVSEPHCFVRSGRQYLRSRLGGGVGSSNRIRRKCGLKCKPEPFNDDYRYALNNAQYLADQAEERSTAAVASQ